jgi:hypothetical protein
LEAEPSFGGAEGGGEAQQITGQQAALDASAVLSTLGQSVR